jgi:alpha/beta superfamily hydrolase
MLKSLFGIDYDDLWKAVIRPPKDEYTDDDLGPTSFLIDKKLYKRTDIILKNKRGHKLVCSHWEPCNRELERLPCVVYLHGNCSSRVEAVSESRILLPMNITLFAFDFSACGKSEGEYISLGWYEKEDVECVIEYLRRTNTVSTIGLWGRSMGAVTALLYGVTDPTIAGIVLDSPFSSLKLLVEELVKDKVSLPGFIVSGAIKMVKSSVKKRANFDLNDIEPINYAKNCFIPALFCSAKNDDFVKPHHSKKLFEEYQGEKNITSVDGDHNSVRPKYFKDSAAIFFYNSLQVENLKQISDNYSGYIKKDENKIDLSIKTSENKCVEDVEDEEIIDYDEYDLQKLNNLNLNENISTSNELSQEEKDFLEALELSKKEFERENEKNNKNK